MTAGAIQKAKETRGRYPREGERPFLFSAGARSGGGDEQIRATKEERW
jgi:hypothetical protein